ncbi:lysyl-tRNA synthetase [Salpingoeca rosetta]|uniref:Lysine--tRNA ligase n=1 Tax=Salpingoeca rosetta (strain ATCC 50818 / BSB-021) TaxID=946362 RepID=F2UFY8_SALR5|nr:lysyl-tRNA synthetase [Salpingoeca rosetta]EGD75416.1 lysyl-tRNA synthetase [Salpingoeca rosetta]|eukprot:XP_004991873.1 lysyl-tRNA synthetase [Salpingoeca rosetta]
MLWRAVRRVARTTQRTPGIDAYAKTRPLYPCLAEKLTPIQHIRDKYIANTEPGQRFRDEEFTIAGRVTSKRQSGKKICFYDIEDGISNIQVVAFGKDHRGEDYEEVHAAIRRGDIARVTGYPGTSKSGELSLFAQEAQLLAPCWHNIPDSLTDVNLQLSERPLHMLVNQNFKNTLLVRSQVLQALRSFLVSRGFVEVETPILGSQPGGASARPFWTKSNALDRDYALRVAPELYLKKLVVGGLPRVFEIGKVFRNEGIDRTHNPEFTSCELYQAYAPFEELFDLTEHLLRHVVQAVTGGSLVLNVHGTPVDLSAPFQRLAFVDTIEKATGTRVVDAHTGNVLPLPALADLCEQHGISTDAPLTAASLLDRLAAHFIEPLCVQPTFVYGHPTCLSPLAKQSQTQAGISDRFELYIDGKEIVNAYNELNDPDEQRSRFREQEAERAAGDDEAQVPDEDFCRALEYGLPPTVGWGMGIDRLIMLLTDTGNIRDVIAFPMKA